MSEGDEMADWQPIETAPHGGQVLVYEARHQRVRVANFNEDRWVTRPGDFACYPTHWMPLPEPPK
jgi:hypothetical protein